MLRIGPALFRLAWRDLRGSARGATFVAIACALSIAGITGVRGAETIAQRSLDDDAHAWLGGDLALTTTDAPDADQLAAFEQMRSSGTEWTVVSTGLAMGASATVPDPAVVAVKVVDPSRYPLYGPISLLPAQRLEDALSGNAVVVSPDILERFHVNIGDSLMVAGEPLRISAVILEEPDRYSGWIGSMAFRVMLSRHNVRPGGFGASLRNRFLFRLPPDSRSMDRVRARLTELFPEAGILDYRESDQRAIRTLNFATRVLTIMAFFGILAGTLALAIAVERHIHARVELFAILKVLGARNRHLLFVELTQITALTAIGFAAGICLGAGMRAAILALASRYVHIAKSSGYGDIGAIREGAAVWCAVVIPVFGRTVAALLGIRPAALMRRGVSLPGKLPLAPATIGCLLLTAIAARMFDSWKWVAGMAAGTAFCAFAAIWISRAALSTLRRWRGTGFPIVRFGIANLQRPGSRARVAMASLAVAVMFLLAAYQTIQALEHATVEAIPFERTELILAGFEDNNRAELESFLQHEPGIENFEILQQARLRLNSVDGRPLQIGSGRDLVLGAWYSVECSSGPGVVSEAAARELGLVRGSQLEFAGRSGAIRTTIGAIRPMAPAERFWHEFSLDCGGLDSTERIDYALLRAGPGNIEKIRRDVIARYPSLAAIGPRDLRSILSGMDDAVSLARLLGWYLIVAASAVLFAAMSASFEQQVLEVGTLSAVGVSRATLVRLFAVELLSTGALSGLIGLLLGWILGSSLTLIIFRTTLSMPGWQQVAFTILGSAAAALAAGWMPLRATVNRKPLEILRGSAR